MPSIFDVPLHTLTGDATTLQLYRGHVLLIVNTASKCGLTPQYEGLEKLYNTYKHCGLDVLGFPANDFAGQEPGTSSDIQTFCQMNYNITFPMFEKIAVTGAAMHPLYQMLINAQPVARVKDPSFRATLDNFLSSQGAKTNPLPGILWNFEKFLVNRRGQIVARFAPDTLPDDAVVIHDQSDDNMFYGGNIYAPSGHSGVVLNYPSDKSGGFLNNFYGTAISPDKGGTSVTAAHNEGLSFFYANYMSCCGTPYSNGGGGRVKFVDSQLPTVSGYESLVNVNLVGSPFTYANTFPYALNLNVTGGAVQQIEFGRNGEFGLVGSSGGSWTLQPGDQLRVTYTMPPVMVGVPQ